MFYLSPATSLEDFERLKVALFDLFTQYPLQENKVETINVAPKNTTTEWVALDKAIGRICAGLCGLFPPCTPLFHIGEEISENKVQQLRQANNVFGLKNGKILIYKEE